MDYYHEVMTIILNIIMTYYHYHYDLLLVGGFNPSEKYESQ